MPQYLETTADKFTFRVATDRLYTAEGLWVLPEAEGSLVRVGLADYLQQHNGDVAFANVKPSGTPLKPGETFAEIETIKAMLEVHAPISGKLAQANEALNSHPEVINQDPYGNGWLAILQPGAWDSEQANLLQPAAYFAVLQRQLEQDLKGT